MNAQDRYNHSEKGRESRRRYRCSVKGRAAEKRYRDNRRADQIRLIAEVQAQQRHLGYKILEDGTIRPL